MKQYLRVIKSHQAMSSDLRKNIEAIKNRPDMGIIKEAYERMAEFVDKEIDHFQNTVKNTPLCELREE